MKKLCALMALLAVGAGPAEEAPLLPGTEVFRSILAMRGAQPIEHVADLHLRQDRKVLIIFGEIEPVLPQLSNFQLDAFLNNGGSVLIATDYDSSELTSNLLGVNVVGDFVEAPSLEVSFRRNDKCPFVESVPATDRPFRLTFKRVATNRPSRLSINRRVRRMEVFATLPKHSGIRASHGLKNEPQLQLPFGAVGVSTGRCMVLADHSIFINSMMLQPPGECDNFKFAADVVDWLTEGGKRKDVLMIENGTIKTHFDLSPRTFENRLPHPDVLMPALDHMIIGLEKENAFNRAINQFLPRDRLVRGLLFTLCLLLVAWGLYFITAGKFRYPAYSNRLPDHIDELANPFAQSERRRLDLPRGDLAKPAQELALQFFDEIGVDVTKKDLAPQVYSSAGARWHRWPRRVSALWEIATGNMLPVFTAKKLQSLAGEIDAVRQAIRNGQIEVKPAQSSL